METSKQGFVEATAPYSVVSAQREDTMHGVQTTLPTVYFHTLGGLPLYAQPKPSGAQDPLAFPLSVSQPSPKQALSLLTLHVAGGVHLQQSGQKPGVTALAVRPKSAGKHMCSYCGRDCLKPSVLEKHLRCHTGERPYPCTTCGVAFKTQSNLYKHKRTQAHARLSSDSSERDSLTSQESVQGSRDVCWSMSSLEGQCEGSSSLEKDVSVPVTNSSSTTSMVQVSPGQTGHDTGWGLQNAAAVGLILVPANGNQEPHNSAVQSTAHCVPHATQQKHEQGEHPAPPVPARHLSLQRQEATFFSKQWDSRMSGGKSQNHDSTDSGFSESSEQHWSPSPSGTLHDHSMESLAEFGTEEQDELRAPQSNTNSGATTGKGAKNRVSLLEKRKLEERICKLISENDALVDNNNKHLENVRPRKTMPSKQGSIDLPMPYTYKDSFHFEMKSSRHSIPNTDWQNSEKQLKQALYSSVPTQRSLSLEHAPLVRSSSLPFNVGSSGFERASTHGSYQAESTQQSGRNRMGQVYPGDLLMRSMDQPTPHHRSLVRQKAVDGLPAADFPNLPSSEEHFSSGFGGEGNSVEPTGEASGGKFRRKKLPKFSYNKWYMYGDGTFRKLCNMEKGSDRNAFRAKKSGNSMEQDKGQEIHSKNTGSFRETQNSGISTPDLKSDANNMDSACNPSQVPPHLPPSGCVTLDQAASNPDASNAFLQKRILRNPTVSTQQSVTKQSNIQTLSNKNDRGVKELDLEEENSEAPSSSSQGGSHLPSERKKQRTDENICMPVEKTDVVTTSLCAKSKEEETQNQWLPFISDHTTEKYTNIPEYTKSIPEYTNIPEQKNTVMSKDKIMDFKTSPFDHQLNHKNIQLQGYESSPSQENVRRLSALTKSSFLPKYQLKLPQSSDLMTSASCLTGMEQSLPSTQNQQVTEKPFSSNTPMTGEGQTFAPIIASLETHIDKPSGTAVNRQSPPTSASSTTSVIGNDHITAVTPISAHSKDSYLSPSSQIMQYKGKMTLLNSAKPNAAESKGHDREQAGDIHIFLEIFSGEQLSVTETQRESKQEAVYRKDILQDMNSPSTSAGIQMLCATQKPQERMAAEVQPPVSTAEKTTKEIVPSGEAPSMPLSCLSSDWGGVFRTKQHRYPDEPSQRSSVHSDLSVIPLRSCTNHFTQRDNAERLQNKEHSSSNLDETSTANQEASMQKHGRCVSCTDAQSLNPHICPFQEDVGQISSVSLETCAADKPSEGVIETAEAAEQLPVCRQDAPSLPTPVSVPGDRKVGPYSPRNHKSSSVKALRQAHVNAPQKLFTSDEATESSGGSSPGPASVQQQHRFREMASALQNTVRATIAPLQLIDAKKPSPSQCQEQKMFTCESQHPLSPPHASPSIILPLHQTTWSQSPDAALTSQEGLDLAKKRGTRDGQQTLKIPTDSSISSSDVKALVGVTPETYHCNAWSSQYEEKEIFLLGPNSAGSGVTKSGEKPQLFSPNEKLKVSQHDVAETGSSVLAPLSVSAAQRDEKDLDDQNAFSHCTLTGMFSQASSKTLPTFRQQVMDPGTSHVQQKHTPAANMHVSPPATTETVSRSLLVHVVAQNDILSEGLPFHVGNINSACENDGITLSRTQPEQHREASPVSLSLTCTDKHKLHRNSATCAGTTTGSSRADKPQPMAIVPVTSDVHCQTKPEPSDSQPTHSVGTSLCTKSMVMVTSSISQDRSASQGTDHNSLGGVREDAAAAEACYASNAFPTLENPPADTGVYRHVDVCITSHDPAAAGLLSGVDLRAKHAAQGNGEARGQQRQLEGGEERETKSGGRGLQDGGNLDASPTPGLKQGGPTEGLGVERDAGANETSWCGSLSLQPGVTARQTPTPDTAVLIGQLQPGVTAHQTPTPDTAVLIGQLQPGVTTRQTPTPDTAVLIGQLQPGVTARQTPTLDTAVLIGQLQPGVTARQTPTPDTAVLIGQLQPGVTAHQTPTPDTAVLIGQLQPGVTTRQTPTPDTAVLIGQLQPGVTAGQTPTPDTAVLIGQLQPGVTARQTPTPDTAVLIGQLQPGMQNKAMEVNTLQTPGKTEMCRLRKRQSGIALSHTSQTCPPTNFPVPAKGETGSQLTPRCRPGLFLTPVKNGTTQSADQAEAHNYKKLNKPVKLKRVLQTPPDPPAEVFRPSSCSSMGNLHPVSAAQLLGEKESQADSIGHRTSTSHSLNKRSLQSPEEGLQPEELRTSAQDKPGDLNRRCLQGTGRTPTQAKLTGSAPSQPGTSRSPLIRSHTSPAFCLTPPCSRAKGLGRTEELPGKAALGAREEGPDSSSSDDEGKLVIELE
ncbi:zinc finger protein 831 isoform X2 [Brienomyrus brachyistius]|uniref:zinc finger protein 831 isoform X2 n=1 Tax=Brienomyrus brachyistius TaxID=42636 RepID=UPI0020B1BB15|nr:zinc finger protein 831 isoform X2 [Brienomyrus brachyistius]